MKAAIKTGYGKPSEVLKIKDVTKPIPKDNEILVKVYLSSVNRTDCGFTRGEPKVVRLFSGLRSPKLKISGSEFVGVVEEINSSVKNFKVGDKVFGFYDEGTMSHAQYLTISETGTIGTIPKGVSFEDCLVEGAHYAINFIGCSKIKKENTVIVNGATGAIGSSLVQILKHRGNHVVAVVHSKHTKLAKKLGADKVVNYDKEDFTKLGKKYDFIFDSVGKSTFGNCKKILNSRGVYISSELGPYSQNILFSLTSLFSFGKKVKFPLPFYSNCTESIFYMRELLSRGKFKSVIDREYSLKDIGKAFDYVETGEKIGNVIIRISK
jgi:NADPH:quinone reductase-like Zn-dependent oxidoreductase